MWARTMNNKGYSMKKTICVMLALAFLVVGCSRSPEKYVARGKEYMAEKKYSEAILEFRNALKKNPRFAAAHHELGLAYLSMGAMEEGGQSILQAATMDPNNLQANVSLMKIYKAQDNYDLALYYNNKARNIKDSLDNINKKMKELK